MNALRRFVLVPLSILCFHSTAQVEDLMRDKNITWMVESYNDFLTDVKAEEQIGKRLSTVLPLKFLNKEEGDISDEFALQHYVLEAAKTGHISIFEDANCTKSTTYKIATRRGDENDEPFDAKRYICSLYTLFFTPDEFLFFRARQILYYDSKKKQFGLRTLAVAPMMRQTNEEGKTIGWKPFFWMKVTDLSKKGNLSDDAITWAKRMSLRDGVALKTDSVIVLKKTNDSLPIAFLFQAFLTKPKIPFYRPDSMPLWAKYTFAERQKLFIQRDTITCAGGGTVLEPKIINHDIHASDVVGLRLIQNWYWDDKKKRLEIYLVATAPLIDIKNEADEFLFRQPLFYRRTDD